jgi:hypothetical protein
VHSVTDHDDAAPMFFFSGSQEVMWPFLLKALKARVCLFLGSIGGHKQRKVHCSQESAAEASPKLPGSPDNFAEAAACDAEYQFAQYSDGGDSAVEFQMGPDSDDVSGCNVFHLFRWRNPHQIRNVFLL